MSQLTPTAQDLSSSVKAEQVSATYQLGAFQQEYHVKYTRTTLFSGIAALILATGSGLFGYELLASPRNINDTNNAPFLLVIGVVFLLAALYCLLYPLLYRSWRVYVYSEGFAYTRGGKLDAFRWENIESALYSVTRRYMNGIYMGTQHKYTVLGTDGRKVVLNDRITSIERLGEIISEMVTRVKLPEALASIQAGNTLSFGPLSVSLQGVSNGKETLSWEQVTAFQVSSGIITVRKGGKWLSWSAVPVAKIPNVFVFLALVDAIRKQAK